MGFLHFDMISVIQCKEQKEGNNLSVFEKVQKKRV